MMNMELTVTEQQQARFQQLVPLLLDGNAAAPGALDTAEQYVEVSPQWWGLVFVLSDQAARDLATGSGGVSAVAAGLAAITAAIPGINVAAGLISAVLALHAAIISALNRGKGVYITALWPTILNPVTWIPTPRT